MKFLLLLIFFSTPSLAIGQEVSHEEFTPEQLNQQFLEEKECEDCDKALQTLPTIIQDGVQDPEGILPGRPWFPRPRPRPEDPETPDNPSEEFPDPFQPEDPESPPETTPENPKKPDPEKPEVKPSPGEEIPDAVSWFERIGDRIGKWFDGIFDGVVLSNIKWMISFLIWTVPGTIFLLVLFFFGDKVLIRTASILMNMRSVTDAWDYFWDKKEDE